MPWRFGDTDIAIELLGCWMLIQSSACNQRLRRKPSNVDPLSRLPNRTLANSISVVTTVCHGDAWKAGLKRCREPARDGADSLHRINLCSMNTVVTNGVEFANVRFGSLTQRSYVGWFATEALVAGRWIESASQHPEVRMAMSVSPKRQGIYRVPVPRESAEWRIHWRGEVDIGEVSRIRKMMRKYLIGILSRYVAHLDFRFRET